MKRTVNQTIRAISVACLVIGFGINVPGAYGMGSNTLIDGNKYKTYYQISVGRCVLFGRNNTGQGVEAISYNNNILECINWNQVDDLINKKLWCSTWVVPNSPDECTPGTPILLDLDRNNFHLSAGPVSFDNAADGTPDLITWVSAGTSDAFLFRDENGNGVVDDGSELFGSGRTLQSGGARALHGYEALAEFDLVVNGGNGDGQIDQSDSVFAELMVWIDSNTDGVNQPGESQSLAAAGVVSLATDYRKSNRTDQHGNEFIYLSTGKIRVNGRLQRMWTTDVIFKRVE